MVYTLMQAPENENEYEREIVLVEETTIGEVKKARYAADGYSPVGTLESSLTATKLKRGISARARRQVRALQDRILSIRELANEDIF